MPKLRITEGKDASGDEKVREVGYFLTSNMATPPLIKNDIYLNHTL
jgi:hypothetical protein